MTRCAPLPGRGAFCCPPKPSFGKHTQWQGVSHRLPVSDGARLQAAGRGMRWDCPCSRKGQPGSGPIVTYAGRRFRGGLAWLVHPFPGGHAPPPRGKRRALRGRQIGFPGRMLLSARGAGPLPLPAGTVFRQAPRAGPGRPPGGAEGTNRRKGAE